MHASTAAADPDRDHDMFAVNADALVRLTRAVWPAMGSTSAPDSPREPGHLDSNRRLALLGTILRSDVSNVPQA
jgi:hypothetical protein